MCPARPKRRCGTLPILGVMREWIWVVTLASVLTMVGAMPALAVPPVHERWSFEAAEVLPDDMCGFPLSFEVRGRQTFSVFFDEDGTPTRALATGPIRITFTRGDTDERLTVSIPGPSFYDADFSLVAGTGPWFMVTEDGPVITRGRWTYEDGALKSSGTTVSVCDLFS